MMQVIDKALKQVIPTREGKLKWLASIAIKFRRKRLMLFKSLIAQLPRPLHLLDVGGTQEFWEMMGLIQDDIRITIINIKPEQTTFTNITSMVGDARGMYELQDRGFEVVFSNSVIEHVGSFEEQRALAQEIQRVALLRIGGSCMPNALITGITGQDGSYLAEFLLSKGYTVYGLIRRTSGTNKQRIVHILDQIILIEADLLDQVSLIQALRISRADEIYNLAAMSFVSTSFQQPFATGEYSGLSVTRMLEAVRLADWPIRFYQASSSEMFGKVQTIPQNEGTSFYPRSPYGVAKLYGHWITVNFRESYNLFACSGILFNHESPRRGMEFVTRKISHAVASIRLDMQEKLVLGNLEAKRDWGFAGDYVQAMWQMLQQDTPEDYVIATGVTHSVREFVIAAFACAGIDDWQRYVEVDTNLFRPAEVDLLIGDASKAHKQLGWRPLVVLDDLVKMMVESDLLCLARERSLPTQSIVPLFSR